jgi:drug/metabolite transporter (DMT)-like permease
MTTTRSAASGRGLVLSLVAASTFGTSGAFATALTGAGWSSGAAVCARVSIAALVLTVPAVIQLRRQWPMLRAQGRDVLRRSATMVTAYGLIAVALCQLAYFNAVERLDVGVALLLEYLGVILVVGWMWLRHGQRPRRLTVIGSLGAIAGLALVLDLTGSTHLDPVGVLWGLGAAVGLALFFILSGNADEPLPPITMAWAGMVVGAVSLLAIAATGALPLHARFGDVRLAGHEMSWLVPVLGLSVVAAAVSYIAGIEAARRLGARLASFIGLTEVLFAVLFAWLLLGQLPGRIQLAGGVLIVAGIALVRVDELRSPAPTFAPDTETVIDPETDAVTDAVTDPVTDAGTRRDHAGAAAEL